jgi:hypothetical protein
MLTYEYLVEEYVNKKRSTHEIAEDLNTYPNRVRRALKKHGIVVRDRSEAQTLAIVSGRNQHPTQGKHLSSDHRQKIGEFAARRWAEMSDEEKQRRSEISKKMWAEMGNDRKEEMQQKALEGVRKAAATGSKLEKYLMRGLGQAGYYIDFHVELNRQHIDIYVNQHVGHFSGAAIEVNGPSHYRPIWGDTYHAKRAGADARKSGVLMQQNVLVIIVKDISGEPSEIRMRAALQKLLGVLEYVQAGPGVGTYYEIEV